MTHTVKREKNLQIHMRKRNSNRLRGDEHPRSLLTNFQVAAIRDGVLNHGLSQRYFAKLYSVSEATISMAVTRRSYVDA